MKNCKEIFTTGGTNYMKKFVYLLILLASLTAVIPACAETLVFGTAAEYRPFIFYDYNYELTGLDIDLIKEIGKREGYTVKILDMAFDGLIDSVSMKQIDLIGGAYSITPEREKQLIFSDVYYRNSAVIIASVKGSVPDHIEMKDMGGLRIGVQRGSSFDQWMKTNMIAEGLLNTQDLFTFSTIDGAMKALTNGSLDIIMLDSDTYEQGYKKSGNFKIVNNTLASEEYAYAAAPGSEALIEKVNDALKQMAQDGTLEDIIMKYTQGAGDDADITISRPSQINSEPVLIPTATPVPPVDQPVNCKNVMVYMADVSYPDGTEVNPGTEFTKTWRIYNNGSCKWYEAYTVEFTDGDYMSANSTVIPQLTIPGTVVEVAMKMKAPEANGTYVGYYQMRAPDGTFFGPKLTAKIVVTDRQVSAPPVGAPPVITQWQPNYYKGDNGFCPTVYWTVRDAEQIHFSINNKRLYTTYYPSGSIMLCPGGGKGDYTYGIVAEGTKKVSYVFTYTNTGGGKKQPKYFPTPLPPKK